jgi:3-methyladenine DNA glycosylase AlkD
MPSGSLKRKGRSNPGATFLKPRSENSGRGFLFFHKKSFQHSVMSGSATELLDELRNLADPEIAAHSQKFFKTGPGEYGEGDRFLGIRVPVQRKLAKQFRQLPLGDIEQLLNSEYHEVRLTSLFILVHQYERTAGEDQEAIFNFYIKHLDRVNNWDLVDSSASQIAGHYLFSRDRSLLDKLASSSNLWKRRTAIISTHYFIKQGDPEYTFRIVKKLLSDSHNLIHKACGWMIRETGKQDRDQMLRFLNTHYLQMPRTMLRYAIEHLPKEFRKSYLDGTA